MRWPIDHWGAAELQLAASDVADVDAAFASLTVHGMRMNEMQMGAVDTTV